MSTTLNLQDILNDTAPEGHQAGFVAIVGKPNVGKSTLLNRLLGQRLAAVTKKPSTTRNRILGILNDPAYQMVFVDTPGVIKPAYALHHRMMKYVQSSLRDADVVVLLVAPREKFPEDKLLEQIRRTRAPIILVVNKMDLSTPEEIQQRIAELKEQLPPVADEIVISALKSVNLEGLKALILKYLPEGPAYFPKDQISDRPERFFAAELVREKIFHHYREEIPYGTAVTIPKFQFREADGLLEIDAVIHAERESQKGILIGKKGADLKKVGTAARKALEDFFDTKVFLQLKVRVEEDWKRDTRRLAQFGYTDE